MSLLDIQANLIGHFSLTAETSARVSITSKCRVQSLNA